MYKKLFLIGLLMSGTIAIAADEGADALYAHEKWSAALAAYEKEEDPTPGMLVRMGDCAVRSKNYATGLRHWYRAARGLYWLSYYDIATRIYALEAEVGLHSVTPTPSWYVATSCAAIPPLVWQVCLLLLLLLGAWRVRLWWQHKSYGFLMIVFLGVLFFGGFAWWSMGHRSAVSAIVMQSVTLRTGPDERFTELGKIAPPSPVHSADVAALPNGLPWCKITDGQRLGWAPQSSLVMV